MLWRVPQHLLCGLGDQRVDMGRSLFRGVNPIRPKRAMNGQRPAAATDGKKALCAGVIIGRRYWLVVLGHASHGQKAMARQAAVATTGTPSPPTKPHWRHSQQDLPERITVSKWPSPCKLRAANRCHWAQVPPPGGLPTPSRPGQHRQHMTARRQHPDRAMTVETPVLPQTRHPGRGGARSGAQPRQPASLAPATP